MSSTRTPVERARDTRGKVEAARLWETYQFELAMGEGSAERERELEQAIDILERDFSFLEGMVPGEAEAYAEGRGHGRGIRRAGSGDSLPPEPRPPARTNDGRAKASETSNGGAGSGRRSSGQRSRRGARAPSRRARSRGRVLGPRSRRALEQTGLPSAGRSLSETFFQAVGLMIGVSLLYLLLTDAQRSGRRSAVVQIADATSNAVRRLIAPVDPLAGGRRGGAAAAAGEVASAVGAGSRSRSGGRRRGAPSYPNAVLNRRRR